MSLKIMASIGLDGKSFQVGAERVKSSARGLKKHIGGEFKSMAKGMASMFAFSYISEQIRETADYAAQIRDLSNAFGINSDHLQKLGWAANQSGIELATVMDAHKDLGKSTSEALAGVEGKIWAFKALGISVDEIKGKNIDEVFMRVAKSIADSGPILEPDQVKAIEDLMGGAGFQSLNMMRGDLQEVFQQLEAMGGVIDENAIKKLGNLSDKMAAFEVANKSVWAGMMSFFGETFMFFTDSLTSAIDIIAERFVHLFNMGKNLMKLDFSEAAASMAGVIGGDIGVSSAREGAREGGLKGLALGAVGTLLGGAATVTGVELATRVGQKRDKVKDAAEFAEAQKEAEIEAQQMMEVAQQRKKIQEEMDQIKANAQEKEFSALTNAEKQLALEQQLLEQRKKLAEMPFHDESEIAATELNPMGLFGSDKDVQEKVTAMMQANVDREKALAEYEATLEERNQTAESAAKDRETLAKETKVEPENLVGEAKFDSLSRVGGTVGGKSPALDLAKKQLSALDIIAQSSESTTKCVRVLSGVQ